MLITVHNAHHYNHDIQDQDQVQDARRAGKLVGTDGRRWRRTLPFQMLLLVFAKISGNRELMMKPFIMIIGKYVKWWKMWDYHYCVNFPTKWHTSIVKVKLKVDDYIWTFWWSSKLMLQSSRCHGIPICSLLFQKHRPWHLVKRGKHTLAVAWRRVRLTSIPNNTIKHFLAGGDALV